MLNFWLYLSSSLICLSLNYLADQKSKNFSQKFSWFIWRILYAITFLGMFIWGFFTGWEVSQW